MSDQWETFCDVGYYHMWRLRRKNERGWNDGFHINTRAEAEGLCELLNKLEGEIERERALANEAIATWRKTREERDVEQVKAERYRLEANAMMLQRDNLVDALDLLLDGLLTYAPDYMHGLPKRHYVDEAMEALAAVKGGSHE
jgi:hypothetical protein